MSLTIRCARLFLSLACRGAGCTLKYLEGVERFIVVGYGPEISSRNNEVWQWQQQPEGWLFAATWLLFGPPVMVETSEWTRLVDSVFDYNGIT